MKVNPAPGAIREREAGAGQWSGFLLYICRYDLRGKGLLVKPGNYCSVVGPPGQETGTLPSDTSTAEFPGTLQMLKLEFGMGSSLASKLINGFKTQQQKSGGPVLLLTHNYRKPNIPPGTKQVALVNKWGCHSGRGETVAYLTRDEAFPVH